MQALLPWWGVFFFLEIVAFPFISQFFSKFFDKGYIFAKLIGLISLSYLAYVLGTLHILPFSSPSLIALCGLLSIVSFFLYIKKNTLSTVKKHWKIFLFEESLFFAALTFWSYVKSFQPDIHGLEKFMDYGFVNSILRTTYFPTKDMWMAPLSINYYYFGHIMTAVATKLSFLPSNITFNLMLATLFSFTFVEGFSLGANLIYLLKDSITGSKTKMVGIITAGLLTASLLTFSGNLHTMYTLFTPYQNENPVPPTQLLFSPTTFPNQYWYPNATRFIYHTIHEFPMYSFVVSDLHGHVLDIPSVLLMIGLLLLICVTDYKRPSYFFIASVLLGTLCGIMYMTNAWDGLIYVGVCAVVLFVKSFCKNILETIFTKKFLLSLLILFISFLVAGLPFSSFFKPFASQIGLNCAPEFLLSIGKIGPFVFERGYCQHSPLWQLAILYGFFVFWFVSFIAFYLWYIRLHKKTHVVDTFVGGLGILGFILIIIPEFFYLKDIYTTYFRANTMFKLVYQSFILLSLVSGYTLVRILQNLKTKKYLMQKVLSAWYIAITACLLIFVFIYPYFAIMSYFNNLKTFKGLDGTAYLKEINSDDYYAIQWINSHIKGQPVMLEAQGDSYTDYERISANTGLPTVFGWMVHEWLWRGTYDIVPGRIADVQALYTSDSIQQTKQLLQKYHVSYVYIGDMERIKYPGINEKKFEQLGKIIYTSGGVKIYKIL